MNNEFLEKLGLSCEVISAIMTEHQKAISDKEKSHAAFKNRVITALVDGACPSSASAKAEIIRHLSECEGDINEALASLKISDPDAFLSPKNECPVFSSSVSVEEKLGEISYTRIR